MAKATKTKGFEKFISILRNILSLAPRRHPSNRRCNRGVPHNQSEASPSGTIRIHPNGEVQRQ